MLDKKQIKIIGKIYSYSKSLGYKNINWELKLLFDNAGVLDSYTNTSLGAFVRRHTKKYPQYFNETIVLDLKKIVKFKDYFSPDLLMRMIKACHENEN